MSEFQAQSQQAQSNNDDNQSVLDLHVPPLRNSDLLYRVSLWRDNPTVAKLLLDNPKLFSDETNLLRQQIRLDSAVTALGHGVVYAVMQCNETIDRELFEFAFSYFYDELVDEDAQRHFVTVVCDLEWCALGGMKQGPTVFGSGGVGNVSSGSCLSAANSTTTEIFVKNNNKKNSNSNNYVSANASVTSLPAPPAQLLVADEIAREKLLVAVMLFADIWVGVDVSVASYSDLLLRMYNLLMQHMSCSTVSSNSHNNNNNNNNNNLGTGDAMIPAIQNNNQNNDNNNFNFYATFEKIQSPTIPLTTKEHQEQQNHHHHQGPSFFGATGRSNNNNNNNNNTVSNNNTMKSSDNNSSASDGNNNNKNKNNNDNNNIAIQRMSSQSSTSMFNVNNNHNQQTLQQTQNQAMMTSFVIVPPPNDNHEKQMDKINNNSSLRSSQNKQNNAKKPNSFHPNHNNNYQQYEMLQDDNVMEGDSQQCERHDKKNHYNIVNSVHMTNGNNNNDDVIHNVGDAMSNPLMGGEGGGEGRTGDSFSNVIMIPIIRNGDNANNNKNQNTNPTMDNNFFPIISGNLVNDNSNQLAVNHSSLTETGGGVGSGVQANYYNQTHQTILGMFGNPNGTSNGAEFQRQYQQLQRQNNNAIITKNNNNNNNNNNSNVGFNCSSLEAIKSASLQADDAVEVQQLQQQRNNNAAMIQQKFQTTTGSGNKNNNNNNNVGGGGGGGGTSGVNSKSSAAVVGGPRQSEMTSLKTGFLSTGGFSSSTGTTHTTFNGGGVLSILRPNGGSGGEGGAAANRGGGGGRTLELVDASDMNTSGSVSGFRIFASKRYRGNISPKDLQ